MKSFALPVAVATIALLLADHASAQSGIRYVAMAGGKPVPKATRRPSARLTSQAAGEQVEEKEGAYSAGELSGGYVANGGGWFGSRPDFGVLPGGMSVWPGVPACCDPWLGYCGEPRCNHCSCGRGRYLYYRCNKDTCTPELVTWGGKCSKCGQGCSTCGTCANCASCSQGSYQEPTPAGSEVISDRAVETSPEPTPDSADVTREPPKKSPPRNKLPKIPTPSALGKTDWFRG
ncbi:MAG TPA: hypothetical protein VGN12_17065 [Pirellulales bacterium]|jgi:hypothetical protein